MTASFTGSSVMSEEELEKGKRVVWQMLERLADDFVIPLAGLTWKQTDKDFDHLRWSIVDLKSGRVVLKVQAGDLEDCPTTPSIRTKVQNLLRQAVESAYPGR
jgi:hypothetical protein